MLKGVILAQYTRGPDTMDGVFTRTNPVVDGFMKRLTEQCIKVYYMKISDCDTGEGNPYEIALCELHLDCASCIAIANTEYGVSMAKEAGIPVIGFEDPNISIERIKNASYILNGFEEIDSEYLNEIYKRQTGQPLIILETERCKVREMTVEDLDSLYELYNSPEITQYMEDLYEDRVLEKDYITAYIKNMYFFRGYGMWLIFEKETNHLIGRAGLEHRAGYQDLELGYVIDIAYQRMGYAFEVCLAILKYAKEKLDCDSIHLFVKKENIPSLQLCRKLGFTFVNEIILNGETMQMYQHNL